MSEHAIAHHEKLAHHFDDMEQQYASANLGMWIFLATEVMFFGGLFAAYGIYRWMMHDAFAEGSKHMNYYLGTLNTAVLLVSSYCVVLAVHAAEVNKRRQIVGYLLATIALAITFLVVKGFEYSHHYHEHLFPGPHFEVKHPFNPDVDPREVAIFMSLYLAMTGLHALHMVIGIGVLSVIAWMAHRGDFSPEYRTPLEMSGLYWHFVDVVWVFLFPLIYLIELPT
jgi:cytochrome c oxidase subunit 3